MVNAGDKFTKNVGVPLATDERVALAAMCEIEKREARQQAAMLIRWALQMKGYLPLDEPPYPPRQPMKPTTHQAQDI